MKVLVSGATGLLGGALARLMLREDHEVRCLLRPESPNASRLDPEAEVAYGDAGDADSVSRALRGVDALVTHASGNERADSRRLRRLS